MPHSITEIIVAVNKRTENRGEKKLDMRLEFWMALQEFCRENHFWWRHKTARFSTVLNTASYDLTADSGANADDLDEIIRVFRIDSATDKAEIYPILREEDQIAAYETATSAAPTSYFLTGAVPQTLRLGAPADSVVPIRFTYWATPQTPVDPSANDIPLVPHSLHWCLVTALEYHVLEVLLGENDPRAQQARLRYDRAVERASQTPSWTTNRSFEMRSGSDAVRATG